MYKQLTRARLLHSMYADWLHYAMMLLTPCLQIITVQLLCTRYQILRPGPLNIPRTWDWKYATARKIPAQTSYSGCETLPLQETFPNRNKHPKVFGRAAPSGWNAPQHVRDIHIRRQERKPRILVAKAPTMQWSKLI